MPTRKIVFLSFLLSMCTLPSLLAQESSCSDGIDNDGDGLIDCYDSDCSGNVSCNTFFYGQTASDCNGTLVTQDSFQMVLKYATDSISYPLEQRHGVFVGDANNDGTVEIFGLRGINSGGTSTSIYIFNGEDGSLLDEIPLSRTTSAYEQIASADVDGNDSIDIFLVGTDNYLYRYEYGKNTDLWQSSQPVEAKHMSGSIVDFDHDGNPEVYVGNAIFDAATGTRLVNFDVSLNQGKAGTDDSWPLAFEVKPGGNLELVAGGAAYLVDLGDGSEDNGSLSLYSSVDKPDGYVSVADFDGDGIAEFAISSEDSLYIWEPDTSGGGAGSGSVVGYSIKKGGVFGGSANIGNYDDDEALEIGVASKNSFQVFEFDPASGIISEKWAKVIDDGSGRTGCTLFDFEGDGVTEIVYSDEEHLYIWRGSDGKELAKIVSQSGTRTDYPIVADIDNDGQAEILASAQNFNGPNNYLKGFIGVYEAADKPWMPALTYWNQHQFHITNINPAGVVPIYQQDHTIVPGINFFLSQAPPMDTLGNGVNTVADLAISITDYESAIDLSQCGASQVGITFQACNIGKTDATDTIYVGFWDGSPNIAGGKFLALQKFTTDINIDACISFTDTITLPSFDEGNLYLTINHRVSGFSSGDITSEGIAFPDNSRLTECNFANNYFGPVTISACNLDRDGDDMSDSDDIDDDNDGIPDLVEHSGFDPFGDEDNDAILNYWDTSDGGSGDASITDYTDSNGDGIPDVYDLDLDGIHNHYDLDSDNDGIPDLIEAGGADQNGDGIADVLTDTDADGLPNPFDSDNSGTSIGSLDSDFDGVPNYLDLDSDNDGIADVTEAGGVDVDQDGVFDGYGIGADLDADGWIDLVDGDADNDQTIENEAAVLVLSSVDADANGLPDSGYSRGDLDGDDVISSMDVDADNDGLLDNLEGQSTSGYAAPASTDTDGDGILNAYEAGFLIPTNTDGSGLADFLDTDADDDGMADIHEAWDRHDDGDNLNDLTCLLDEDGDGLLDCFDGDDGDSTKVALGPTPPNDNGFSGSDYSSSSTSTGTYANTVFPNNAGTFAEPDWRDADGCSFSPVLTYPITQTSHIFDTTNVEHISSADPTGSIRESDFCDGYFEGGWKYYFNPMNPNQMSFSIAHQTNTTPIDYIELRRGTDLDRQPKSGSQGHFVMNRDWFVQTLEGTPLDGKVSIRFYFDPVDSTSMMDSAEAFALANGGIVQAPTWFKVDDQWLPNQAQALTGLSHLTGYTQLTAAQYGAEGGLHYVQFDSISSFSGGGLATEVTGTLPLDDLWFEVSQTDQQVHLNWAKTDEAEVSSYTLERAYDPHDFSAIFEQRPIQSNSAEGYQWRDLDIQMQEPGLVFYRIQVKKLDGSSEYSSVKSIRIESIGLLVNLHPNPATENAQLSIYGINSSHASLKVQNILGKVIYQRDYANTGSSLELTLPSRRWAPGIYLIVVEDDRQQAVRKLQKY